MTDIKRTLGDVKDTAIEKKGEVKGRLKQIKQQEQERSANEE